MRRSPVRKQSESVTLFPFLAVLICTMGSLIVLLVMVIQQADVHAKEKNDEQTARVAEEQKQLEAEKEREDFRQRVLAEMRPQVVENLAERRAELGFLEQDVRDLREQAKRVQRQIELLEQSEQIRGIDLRSERDKLEILRDEIAKTREKVAEAQKRAKRKPRSFAIIPYQAGNGTRRRPVYIECTKFGIVIQPEGIVLSPKDFQPPLLPGNPLDAALLATRQYLERVHGDQAGNPYPLLIVRPDGTEAYQFARAAMKSWDDEFGYELIDADMPLAFPPADPNLVSLLRQTVEDARKRQAVLAAAQPARFRSGAGGGEGLGGGAYGLRASPNGGFVMEPLDGVGSVSTGSARDTEEFRRQILGASAGNSPAERRPGTRDSSNPRGSTGRGSHRVGGEQPPGYSPGSPETRWDDAIAEEFAASESRLNDEARGRPRKEAATSRPIGQAPDGDGGLSSTRPPQSNGQGNSASPGFGQPNGDAGSPQGGPTRALGGSASVPESLARGRGEDWALPEKAPGAVAVRRPIRMLCFADHLVIMPSRGSDDDAKIVNFDASTSTSVNRLTSEVWSHMEGWGIAGRSAYWRPELKVEVAPNGQQRFAELEALMQNSGFDFERVTK